jgi:L-ascorbate metabolism protein UlaG (beta-lactamase superfamily)
MFAVQKNLMKTIAAILVGLCLLLGNWRHDFSVHAAADPAPQGSAVLKWLGTAGWEIRYGETVILIDPFLTRGEANPNAEWKTDEAAVLKVITRADYIFAGHSHADHIADVPFIAKKFGAKVIGSRTTTNIALTAGVDKSQIVTISGGEKLDFKEFSVEVIESRHGWHNGRPVRKENEEIPSPWRGPIRGSDFVDGGSYLYYFTFGQQRVLHQSTGNVIEAKLKGLRPDVALMNSGHQGYDLSSVLKILNPKIIIVHHFDRWQLPFADGLPDAALGRGKRFTRDVNAIDKNIKVIIPKYFETYTLE